MTEEQALAALADRYGIDAPQALVDEETARLEQEFFCRMRYENLSGAVSMSAEEAQAHLETVPLEAARLVRERLVVDKIIRTEGLTVTREELEAEARAIAVRQEAPLEMVMDFLGADLTPLRRDLLERKALELACTGLPAQSQQNEAI